MTIWIVSIGMLLLGLALGILAGKQSVTLVTSGPDGAGLQIRASSGREALAMLDGVQRVGANAVQAAVLAQGASTQASKPQARAM